MATTSTRPRGSISIQVFLGILVAASVGAGIWRRGPAIPAATAQATDETRARPAQRDDAQRRVELAPVTTGVITAIEVRPGDLVRAGDVLVRIDDRAESAARDEARAALEVAATQRAQLETRLADDVARADGVIARVEQELAGLAAVELEAGVVPSSDRAQLEVELENANARRAQAIARADDLDDPARRLLDARRLEAEAALRRAEVALEQRTIQAPVDGRVTDVVASLGETAAPGVPVVVVEADVTDARAR